MSKDVRRLFAAQKAAKAASSSPVSAGSGTPSLSSTSKRVTHPLAKYDPKTLRLTCAICGPAVPIRSDSLWNAHLVSKSHQEAVAKLRAVKEQMQRREAEAAERQRLQQQKQSQQQGVKRKATGGLVAYADDSESEDENDDDQEPHKSNNNASAGSDTKRVKIDNSDVVEHDRNQVEQDIEDEEDAMAGLPAGFFDAANATSSSNMDPVTQRNGSPAAVKDSIQNGEEHEDEPMEGVLPSGFFDDPEQDARIRAEVGGATTDLQQRQIDAEFKALQADLARDFERQEQQEAALRSGQAPETHTSAPQGSQATNEHIPYEEKVELEDLEVEESILARSEEEYLLFVEMQERLEVLREKKERLAAPRSSAASSSTPSATQQVSSSLSTAATTTSTNKPRKQKSKSILELVREQEKAKRDKERLAAEAFARLSTADDGDRRMTGDGDESEEDDEDDEDIEAMMDWRARRV
ncbi:hypothetical protein BGZ68_004011 [Mortierella alpina]|nr:hypothetical protein BGZ68_004011 [Mortierella alpina]